MMLLQRKIDPNATFNRNWTEFKNGFRDSSGNFWLGNEKIHQLTINGSCGLRINFNLSSSNQSQFVEYTDFQIANESDNYQILSADLLNRSSNIVVDALYNRLRKKFTTIDSTKASTSTTISCASKYQAGFWYGDNLNSDNSPCGCMNLNGVSNNFCWSYMIQTKCANVALRSSEMWLMC